MIPESIRKISIGNSAVASRNHDDEQLGISDAIHNSIVTDSDPVKVSKIS